MKKSIQIEGDSPQAADAMIKSILDAIEYLKLYPYRPIFEQATSKLARPVRMLSVRPYVVYFRILEDENIVRIIHVRHGARRKPTGLN